MPEQTSRRPHAIAAFLIATVLALAAGFGGAFAAVGIWLAQPAFALAVRWWRGQGGGQADGGAGRDFGQLLVLWGAAALAAALLAAWPLSVLVRSGSLGAVLALSAVAGIAVIGLWRVWPLWHAVERDGRGLAPAWRALAGRDAAASRGAVLAALVATVLALHLVLAWPGLLEGNARWAMAVVATLVFPLAHWLLQRIEPAGKLPMQVIEMPGEAAQPDPEPEPVEGDLDAALYAAARGGRVERALELLELGADPHALPAADARDRRSLPVLAAVLPDLRLLRELIARGVDVNAAHGSLTPLLAATRDSWHGRPEAVMTLLANGADSRVSDADGNTPMHHAARSSDPGVVALLRDAAAGIDVANNEGLTPLGVACQAGNWRLARFLLERGARAHVDGAIPALVAAAGCEEDDAAGVQLLLRHKAGAGGSDREGRTALHRAAHAGHAAIAAELIAAGADVAASDEHGRTPLLEAARGARLATLEVLADAGADATGVDAAGRGALALACLARTPSPPLVRRLLELGADPQLADGEGRRAVDHAAAAGRWSLVVLVDPEYALPASVQPEAGAAGVPDRAPLSLLREGLREGRFEGLDDLAGLLTPQELGGLLLDEDAPVTVERIDWLMARGADADVRADAADAPGDTALFSLLARGAEQADALRALLRHNVSPAGAGGLARFLAACARGDHAARGLEQLALELLERGADPFAPAEGGDPPLSLAVRLGWMEVLEELAAAGVDLDARDGRGMTALHLSAALGRETALRALVRRGANPEARAADGQTPLGVALAAGRRDLAGWLDWRGWKLPRRPLQPEDLPAAAGTGDADAVRRLLDLGFAVDTVDAQGCTALLRAAGGGHAAVVDLLLERGASGQLAAHTGATPLSAAVSMGHGDIVERLLASGAALEQRLPGEVTVLMLAAALGLPELCARLLTAGANVHATDAQGLTPLHCAALYGFTSRERARLMALFDTLLLAGAEPDAEAAGGVTPLLLLLGARAEPGATCDEDVVGAAMAQLLDEDVSLDAQDPRGFGPLHLACLHGLLQLSRSLLRAGADPDGRDTLNRTPREIAVMRGFIDVAAELAPAAAQPGVSMARFLRD